MKRRAAAALLLGVLLGCGGAAPEVKPPAPAVPQAAALPPAPSFRLPTTARPTRISATLDLDPAKDTFLGEASLELTLSEPTRVVWLNLRDLDVASVDFVVAGQKHAAHLVTGNDEIAGFAAHTTLPAGPVRLDVRYTGHVLINGDRGVFRETEAGSSFLFSQFENTDARTAIPCFDEPSFKVPWQLTLRVPKDAVALSNTPPLGEEVLANGTKVVRFAETLPLPSYLVAFAVGPFELVDAGRAGKNKVPIRYAVPPGRGAETQYIAAATPKLLDMLEEAFGIPYPYAKLDIVSIPQLVSFGAMENAGLITAGGRWVLAKPAEDTPAFRQNAIALVAHELAHQWFGDLVTMAWWDDVWLNEGFATWMEQGITHTFDPSFGQDLITTADVGGVMREDSLLSARKVREEVRTADDIQNAFDGITYQKGAALLGMFEGYVGKDAFRRGVRTYLDRHAQGNATSADFLSALRAGSGVDIEAAFASFLDRPGVPLVNAKLVCEGKDAKLALSQERYLPLGSRGAADEPPWQLPVCARYGAGKVSGRACAMLTAKTGELALPPLAGQKSACPDWVLPKGDGRGYYRVGYTLPELELLLGARGEALTPAERLALFSDARALVDAGRIPLGDVLVLAAKGVNEADPAVAGAAARLLHTLHPAYLTKEELPRAQRFVDRAIAPRLQALGLLPKAGEVRSVGALRELLLDLLIERGSDEKLLAEADAAARRWLDDPKSLPPAVAPRLLRAATRRGDRALFDRLLLLAKAEGDARRRETLIGALATFSDPELVRATVTLFVEGAFDPRDSIGLLWNRPTESRPAFWTAVTPQFDAFVARLPEELRSYVVFAAEGFCDGTEAAQVEAFLRPRAAAITGLPRMLDQTVEAIHLCAAQKAAYRSSLAKLLATR
jgi:alanyl aminopeptidase